MKINLLIAIFALLLMASCGASQENEDYLSRFKPWNKERVEFDPGILGEAFDSPYGLGKVHPVGKIDAGEGLVLALVGKTEGEEEFGEVIAELFADGSRVDQLSIAEADIGIYIFATLKLPGLFRWKESEDSLSKGEKFIISKKGFDLRARRLR